MWISSTPEKASEYDNDGCLIPKIPEVVLWWTYSYWGTGGAPNKETIRAFDAALARYKQDHHGEIPEEMADEDGNPMPKHQSLINEYRRKVQINMISMNDQLQQWKRFSIDSTGELSDPFYEPENTTEINEIINKYAEYPILWAKIANGMYRNVNPRVSYNRTVERVNWYAENYPELFPGFLEHIRGEDWVMIYMDWADTKDKWNEEVLEARWKGPWREIRMHENTIYLKVWKGHTWFDLNTSYEITQKSWNDAWRNFEKILADAEQHYDNSPKGSWNPERWSHR